MKKRMVIALGGNALGNNLIEQKKAVKNTVKVIADLVEDGHDVVISHGNGPQVGMIHTAMSEYSKGNPNVPTVPLSVCVAMSQGYIGYDLQNALREELLNRGIDKGVATIITQVRVDPNDKAFKDPSKPIGRFMTKKEADFEIAKGEQIKEDAGRGYRKVVASPRPVKIIEINIIKALLDNGVVVIAVGGGGIPVISQGNHLKGMSAVIDKDFASCILAKAIDADCLMILTAVEKVAINFGKPNEKWLSQISIEEAKQFIEEGQFSPGSMLPKMKAAVEFAASGGNRCSLITLLEKAREGVDGETGTIIQ